MARARTKSELLDFGENEFQKLMGYVKQFEEDKALDKYIFDNRTIKDILSHLEAWYQLVFIWYKEEMNGGNPDIPAQDILLRLYLN